MKRILTCITLDKNNMKPLPKLYIIGPAGSGKDVASELLAKHFRFRHISSSLFVCEKAVLPTLSARYGYKSVQEAFDDKDGHRDEWFDLISEYNRTDPSRLSRELFQEYDIYCGLRSYIELSASRNLADIVIWIDATKRIGISEQPSSITITRDMADVIIENNGTLEEFEEKIIKFGKLVTS